MLLDQVNLIELQNTNSTYITRSCISICFLYIIANYKFFKVSFKLESLKGKYLRINLIKYVKALYSFMMENYKILREVK